jgi:hypothetical protein
VSLSGRPCISSTAFRARHFERGRLEMIRFGLHDSPANGRSSRSNQGRGSVRSPLRGRALLPSSALFAVERPVARESRFTNRCAARTRWVPQGACPPGGC